MGSYLNRQILRIVWIVLLFIGYQAATAFLSTASSLAGTNPDLAAKYIGLTLIASALLLWLFHWLYQKQLAKNNPRHFGHTPLTSKRLWQFILLFAIMFGIQLIWSQLIVHHILPSPSNQKLVDQGVMQLPLWNTIYDCIAAPYFEETIFRGFFLNFFFSKNTLVSNVLGVFVSGLIFGYLHTLSFNWTLLLYASLGWLLSFSYLYFKDIRYNIALHMLNNILGSI